MQRPTLSILKKIDSSLGTISVAEILSEFGFVAKRAYWIYGVPEYAHRGGHAHRELTQLLIAVAGTVRVEMEGSWGELEAVLDSPNVALTIHPGTWRNLRDFSSDCVLLALASEKYSEDDYIRDYSTFKKLMVDQ